MKMKMKNIVLAIFALLVLTSAAQAQTVAPVLTPIGAQGTTENVLLSFGVTATDGDITIPTLTTLGLPTGASFIDNTDGTGTFSWTPTFTDAGVYNVTFYANDIITADIDSELVVITVTDAGNQAPVLALIGAQGVTENVQLLFNISATDPDATTPTFSATGLPTGAVFTDNLDGTGTFDWTPSFTDAGTFNVTFTTTDGLLTDNEIVTITVTEAGNQAPVLAVIGAQGVTENVQLLFNISATDPDATTPNFTVTGLPTGAVFTDNLDGTGTFDWTPSFTDAGTFNVTFTTTDGLLTDNEIVTITVTDAGNQAPVLAVIGAQGVTENVQLLFNISATDPDATTPNFSATGLPTGAVFTDNLDGTGTFDWTPSFTDAGTFNVTFTTTDGLLTDNEIVTITVTDAGNQAPVLAVIGAQGVTENVQLLFNISATDPDATTPTFSATGLPTGAVFTDNLDGTGTFDWTPSFTDAGTFNVTFTTTDGLLTDNEIVTITVTDAGNQAPVLAVIGAQGVTENVQLLFNISATDPDATTPNFTVTGLPTGAVFTDNLDGTGTFDWTPSFTDAGTFNVTFTTTDGLLTDNEIVTITVTDAGNQAPVLAVIGAQGITENIQLLFNISATDPDATTPNFTATGLPTGAVFTDNLDGTGTFDWTPSFTDAGTFNVTFTTTDGLLTDNEIVTITVTDAGNQAPVVTIIPDQTIIEGAIFTTIDLNTFVSDVDNLNTELTWSFTGNTELTVAIDVSNIATITMPTTNWNGAENITFTATDPGLLFASDAALFTATAVNDTPVLAIIGSKFSTENTQLLFNISATDVDGTIPTFTTSTLPTGVVFTDNLNGTATFDWTPNFTQAGIYNVTFRAEDGIVADTEIVTIQVFESGNQAPVLAVIGAQNVNEGVLLSFGVSASDPDLTTPTLSTSSLPLGATFVDNLDGTGSFSWTPSFVQNGSYDITFIATDGVLNDVEIVTITVNEAGNQAPALALIGAQGVTENVQLLFNISATDPDATTPNFSATALPTGAVFTDNLDGTGTFDWTPSFTDAGVFNVTFTTTDGLLTDNEIVTITVTDAGNQAPVLALIGAQGVTENVQLLFNISATDVDGTIPNFSATGLPTGAVFTDNLDGTGTFDWTPSFTDAGTFNVTFTTTDGALTDNEIVTITVTDAGNQAPVLALIGAQGVTENVQLLFNISATDPDGTFPSFTVTGLPVGAAFIDNFNGTATFNWIPNFTDAGVYNVTFTASDGALTDNEIITITVTDAGNQTPVLAVIGAQLTTEGTQLLFNISATDLDGTTPSFTTIGLPTGASFIDNLNGTATLDWTPSFVDAGVYNVTFFANDGVVSDSEIVTITVTEAGNQAPVLAAIGAQGVVEGTQLLLNITATDPDATTPNFTVTGLPTGASFLDNLNGTATFDWTPTFTDVGVYNVTFTTSDGVLTDNEIVTITVTDAGNQAPVLALIGAQAATENIQLLFNISATDVDGTIPNFSATGLPVGAVFTDNLDGTATFDWTPSFTDAGLFNVTFTTTDGALTDNEVVTITVTDAGNQAPVLALIGAQATTENIQLLFNISASDLDGTIPNFSATGLPVGAVFTDNLDGTATFDWTPSFTDAGLFNVTFTTTDGLLTANEIVTITVTEAGNQAPVLAVIGAQGVTENIQLLFNISATDPDATIPTFTATGLPVGASFVDNLDGTGTFDWTPSFTDAGIFNVTFTTTDGLLTDNEIVTITVTDAGNQAPVLALIGAQGTTENIQLLFNISATDVDGTIPTFSATGLPVGAVFTDNLDGTGTFDWTPSFTNAGVYNVTFTTSDGVLTDNEIVTITVTDAGNQAPVLALIGAQATTENVQLLFNISATDVDGTIPNFSATGLPVGAVFTDNLDGTATFDWTPTFTDAGIYNVTFNTTDGLLTDNEIVTITVTDAGNQAPVLALIGAQGVIEGTQLLFNISATDLDGTIPTFTTTGLPVGAIFTDNLNGTATFDWTPTFTDVGVYNVTFTTTDGLLTANEIVTITVTDAGNQTPVLALIGGQATTENIQLLFNISATDLDGTIPTFTTTGLPASVLFTDNLDGTATFDWTPSFIDAGVYNVTFIANDGVASDSEIVTITVNEAGNQAPVLAVIGAQSVTENLQLLFNISATDVDGTIPNFSATGLPVGAVFTDNLDGTATFDWTPTFVDAGVYNVTFTTTDGLLTDNEIVTVTVTEAGNQTPVLSLIGPQGVVEGTQLLFNILATDPDATIPNFTATGLPTGAVFTDNLNGTGTFDWTPSFTDVGIYNVTFFANDGLASDSEIVVVTIADAGNQTPVLALIGAQATTENLQLLFNISATDLDGTIPTFTTTGLPAGAVFTDNLDGTGTFDWTPSFTDAGVYNVTFFANDGVASDSEIVTITVTEAGNQAPALALIGAQVGTENVQLLFNISATDPDATIPTFTMTGLPIGATFVDNLDGTATFDWTPSFTDAGIYSVTFFTTDGLVSDSEIVSITINETGNQTPVLATIGPRAITEGNLLSFALSATDLDTTIPTFTTSILPAGAVLTDNLDGTASFDWTPAFNQAGIYNITFFASDGIASDSEVVSITVNEAGNQLPVLNPIGPQAVSEGIQLLFTVTAVDPDGTIPILTATPLPTGATFIDNGDGTGTFDWTPDFVQAGLYNVTFSTNDGSGPISEIVTITVNDAGNQIPVLVAIGAQIGTENIQLLFGLSATDNDGTIPTFTATGLPVGAVLTDNLDGTASFDWTPTFTDAGIYNVTFFANDGIGSDSEIVVITINEVGNQLPVLALIGDQTISEGLQLLLNLSATDLDNTPIFTTSLPLPTGALFTDNLDGTATFDWTPTFTDVGVYPITFYASDGLATDSELVTITVTEAGNQTPILVTIGPQVATENLLFNLIVTATDGDGTIPTLSTSILPGGAVFFDNLNGTGSFDWTPSFAQAGIYNIMFYASDGVAIDSELVAITVGNINQTPVLDSIGAKAVLETKILTFLVTSSDADGTNPFLTTTALPTGATYLDNNDGTATFNWVPDFGQAGFYNVTFYASDGVDTVFEIVTINVAPDNIPPVLNAIGPQTVLEGTLLTVLVSATDPDGLAPSLRAENSPLNSSFVDNGDGTGTFSFTPNFIQAGLDQVTIVADDGFDIDKEVVIIQIYDAGDQAPQFDSIPAPVVLEGTLLEGVITAFDPDTLTVVIYADTATVPANFSLVDSGNGVASYSFTPDFTQSGLYDVDIIVTDGNLIATITVTFTVTEAGNQLPVLNFVADTFTTELINVSFTVTTSDPDGDFPIVSLQGPPGAVLSDLGNGTGLFSWTPTDLDAGVHDIMIFATDFVDPLLVDSQLMQLTVIDTNRVPIYFISYGGSIINEGDTLQFSVFVTDPDGTIPTIRGFLDGMDTLATNMTFVDSANGTGVLTFVPDFNQGGTPVETFYDLRFEVCDVVDTLLCVETQLRTVRVADKNFPPETVFLDGAGPFIINEGDNFVIQIATIDPENGASAISDFRAENLPLNATFSGVANLKNLVFSPDFTQAGQYFITIISVDLLGAADTNVVDITVLDAGNQAPGFTTILADTTDVFLGVGLEMLISANEPDAQTMIITASPVMLNAIFVDSGNGQATYAIAPDSTQIGTVTLVTFIVTDPILAADTIFTNIRVSTFMRGDLDGDSKYTMNDVVHIVNYLFRAGITPYPLTSGDIDLSGSINVADIAYLINFMYKAGPRPPQ